MKITSLDGREYKLNLAKYIYKLNDGKQRSSLHKAAISLLKSIYPSDTICEEIFLPGCNSKLYLDLFLPLRNLAIECDGVQHEIFNVHHYKSKLEFARAKRRDAEKTELLELNNITLVRLNYNESIDEWRDKVLNRGKKPQ